MGAFKTFKIFVWLRSGSEFVAMLVRFDPFIKPGFDVERGQESVYSHTNQTKNQTANRRKEGSSFIGKAFSIHKNCLNATFSFVEQIKNSESPL